MRNIFNKIWSFTSPTLLKCYFFNVIYINEMYYVLCFVLTVCAAKLLQFVVKVCQSLCLYLSVGTVIWYITMCLYPKVYPECMAHSSVIYGIPRWKARGKIRWKKGCSLTASSRPQLSFQIHLTSTQRFQKHI